MVKKKYNDNKYNIIFIISLLIVFLTAICTGTAPTRKYGHDIFFLLDNGWRVYNGQVPHVDFTSAWGPVTFLIIGFGMLLTNGSVESVGYGSATFGLVIGLWSYYLCGSRVNAIVRLYLSLFMVLLIVAPFPIGGNLKDSSHAMVYNRYGYALLGLIIIEIYVYSVTKNKKINEIFYGFSTGVVISIIFFLKFSYFIGAIVLIGYALFRNKVNLNYMIGLVCGSIISTLGFLFFINFDCHSLFNDLLMAIESRTNRFSLKEIIKKIIPNVPLILFLILNYFMIKNRINNNLFCDISCFLKSWNSTIFVVLFVDILIFYGNAQYWNLPLSIIFCALLADSFLNYNKINVINAQDGSCVNKRIIAPSVLYFSIFFYINIAGMGYALLTKYTLTSFDQIEKFNEARLESLILLDDESMPTINGKIYVRYINDGIDLLKINSATDEKILTLDMFNPFSYALGRIPVKGGLAAAAYDYTISDNYHPSDKKFFGDADIIMVPKILVTHNEYFDGFYKIYEASLKEKFILASESKLWKMYRRK